MNEEAADRQRGTPRNEMHEAEIIEVRGSAQESVAGLLPHHNQVRAHHAE
jgi:hypothetical protein